MHFTSNIFLQKFLAFLCCSFVLLNKLCNDDLERESCLSDCSLNSPKLYYRF